MKAVYHYVIRYMFEDKKISESGHGVIKYDTMTKIDESPFDVLAQLAKEIAFARKHENVYITCYDFIGAELLSRKNRK